MDKSTKMVTIKLENEPDCITEYALKYCINQNQTCDSRHNLESTDSELIIHDAFEPCLEYGVFLLPVSDEKKLMTDEEGHWDNATYKLTKFESSNDPPFSTDSSVRSLTHQAATISWLKPNECVDGYRISLHEIQHLPNLRPTFVDGKNELLTFRMNLSNSDLSLELTNLTSCRLHRADIESFYSSDPGDLQITQLMNFFLTYNILQKQYQIHCNFTSEHQFLQIVIIGSLSTLWKQPPLNPIQVKTLFFSLCQVARKDIISVSVTSHMDVKSMLTQLIQSIRRKNQNREDTMNSWSNICFLVAFSNMSFHQ